MNPYRVPRRSIPYRDTPSLESIIVLTLGIRATFLASRCPSTAIHHPSAVALSNSHNCLKIIIEFCCHLHHRGSSFDLPMNYNRF
ncbi:hypothetical protein GW17_00033409 [Ensete ventricosum]|nr:hypothetical protein GW17_00033409 [Ensete ventricosum]RZR90145.1 hypothetical protein BHM03_00017960 [Ensete ventricosum]